MDRTTELQILKEEIVREREGLQNDKLLIAERETDVARRERLVATKEAQLAAETEDLKRFKEDAEKLDRENTQKLERRTKELEFAISTHDADVSSKSDWFKRWEERLLVWEQTLTDRENHYRSDQKENVDELEAIQAQRKMLVSEKTEHEKAKDAADLARRQLWEKEVELEKRELALTSKGNEQSAKDGYLTTWESILCKREEEHKAYFRDPEFKAALKEIKSVINGQV